MFRTSFATARVQVCALLIVASFASCPSSLAQRDNCGVLPNVLVDEGKASATARWTTEDIVEVRRIVGTAIRGATHVAAFILRQPCVADGKNHYGLYEMDADSHKPPRKLAESEYMADLSWQPNSLNWSVRADLGKGVQLYGFNERGDRSDLVVNPEVAEVGGNDGVMNDPLHSMRTVGVLAYGWSPDGKKLWYSRIQFLPSTTQHDRQDKGLVYDDNVMWNLNKTQVNANMTTTGSELVVRDLATGSDRSLVVNTTRNVAWESGVLWVDSMHLQYRSLTRADGPMVWTLARTDLATGTSTHAAGPADELYYSVPTPEGYLTARREAPVNHLLNVALDGRIVHDYGAIDVKRLQPGSFWSSDRGDRVLLGTHFADHDGLRLLENGKGRQDYAATPDHLTSCSFNTDVTFGVCSRESLDHAPELVSVSGEAGAINPIVRLNARYDAIEPLKTVQREWTNSYGAKNNGYVTYPRGYMKGHAYPALLVSHGNDAQNRFALDWFQWEFPIQVFAEQGYFVLSINEPAWDPNVPPPYFPGGKEAGLDKQQLVQYVNPAATMDGVVQELIQSGDIDAAKVGIAGYSHGAELTVFVINHSKLFSAASLGDDSGLVAGGFWSGSTLARTWMTGLYGGSPFDSRNLEAYRKYSVSFRMDKIKTPMLQQYAGDSASSGLELDQLFKDAGIPTELVDYPGESHIFDQPRHRASAMERNLDWFNYWLLGRRDENSEKATQYARWDAMAKKWKDSHLPGDAATR
jgi:dipeptidyl aminopeptidase/acylaminoacyl peptidase